MLKRLRALYRAAEERVAEKAAGRSAPPPLHLGINEIPGGIIEIHGLPQPQWELLRKEFAQRFSVVDPEVLWHRAAVEWLNALRHSLGEKFTVFETRHFLFLTFKKGAAASYWCKILERALAVLRAEFGALAIKTTPGKHVIIWFDSAETYYRHVSAFHLDGDSVPPSAGIFRTSGFPHIATHGERDERNVQKTLVHELAHFLLEKWSLPTWVGEGVAQEMEWAVLGWESAGHSLRDHLAYWTEERLGRFWRGTAFRDVHGDARGLSYNLSRRLFRSLRDRFGQAALDFVRDCERKDCGQASSLKHFGLTLGQLAEGFLGLGEWGHGLADPAGVPEKQPPALPLLVREYVRAGRTAEARKELEEIVTECGALEDQLDILELAIGLPISDEFCSGEADFALELAEWALFLQPANRVIAALKGGLFVVKGELRAALGVLEPLSERVESSDYERGAATYLLSWAHWRSGAVEQARETFGQALKVCPNLWLRDVVWLAEAPRLTWEEAIEREAVAAKRES